MYEALAGSSKGTSMMWMPSLAAVPLDWLLSTSSRLLARSGTPVAVCEPPGLETNARPGGLAGSLMS